MIVKWINDAFLKKTNFFTQLNELNSDSKIQQPYEICHLAEIFCEFSSGALLRAVLRPYLGQEKKVYCRYAFH